MRFSLNQQVKLAASDETGFVIGRAEYLDACPSYFVRYRAADGRQTEAWWAESALAPTLTGTVARPNEA